MTNPMQIGIKVNSESLNQLGKNLKTLSRVKGLKMATRALYSAASVISEQARQNIKAGGHNKTGNLVRSVGVSGMAPKEYRAGVIIGILQFEKADVFKLKRGDAQFEGIDRWAGYGRFLETGTKHQEARPWLQAAMASQAENSVDKFTDRMGEQLEKEVQKLNVRRSLK